MNHKRPPIPVVILVILAILVAGFFLVRSMVEKDDQTLSASGTIEAVEVALSPEIGGKVVEVYVDEGDPVEAQAPLFRLDDTLLKAQRAVAVANLDLATAAAQTALRAQEVAQANYTLVLNAARLESATTRTLDWRSGNLPGYSLPGGYFSLNELVTAANTESETARSARDAAQSQVNDLVLDPQNAEFIAAETRLNLARASLLVAQDVLSRAGLSSNPDLRDSAQAVYDVARTELDEAQAGYDLIAGNEKAALLVKARAELSIAQERYEIAQDRLLALQIGIDSPKVVAAQAGLNQAVEAAQQAALAVTQAEANLDLLDVQLSKLTIIAPSAGLVLTRSIQPGEVVAAGARVITIARLDDMNITVYVPEDRYGELSLGQSARVTVDSFPGEVFNATILHIASQAEFTPRNVQTVEGRASTVFAIRLQVQDTGGKLKPGMPADVVFENGE